MPIKDDDQQAAFGKIVDKLLKKLPGADPHLRGDRAKVSVSSVPDVPHGRRTDAPATARDRLAVWGRVGLGLVLGGVLNQWPYGQNCGIALYLFMGAIVAVIVAGIWSAMWAWRRRMGIAHTVAILTTAWGAMLAADRILPRIGYAAVHASWRCL